MMRRNLLIALVLCSGSVPLSSARGQEEAGKFKPTAPPKIQFGQVRVAKLRQNAEKPTIMLVGQKSGVEQRTRAVNVTRLVPEKRTRVVEIDGKKVTQEYTVNVPVVETVKQTYVVHTGHKLDVTHVPAATVQAWDIDGKPIPSAQLVDRLAKPKHVFLLNRPWKTQPPVDAFYRSVLNDQVIFLYVPGRQNEALDAPALPQRRRLRIRPPVRPPAIPGKPAAPAAVKPAR